jgi:hypothetical protein
MWMLRSKEGWLARCLGALAVLSAALGTAAVAHAQYACPASWRDAGVPVADPQPIAPPGVPEAEIDALHAYARDAGLGSVAELLAALPAWLHRNHVLVETTRAGHPASLAYPRVLLFGSDARFLLAYGSDPADPKREVVDLAELRPDGSWKLRSLDFAASPPALSQDGAACTSCHGDPPRPFWGSYPSWPGMFGAQQDLVSAGQAERLNELRADPAGSDRFFALEIPAPFGGGAWEAGDIVRLPGRAYAYTNTVLNMELGSAVSDGAFRRLRAASGFRELRDELLTLSYCAPRDGAVYVASGARDAIAATLLALGVSANRDALYRHLGVDPAQAFSLHRLASEAPDANWNVSTDTLFGLVNLLVLHDFMRDDAELLALLEDQPDRATAFNAGCFESAADAVRHKVYVGFTLHGAARQAARAAGMDVNLYRATQGALDPVRSALCPFLYERVQAPPPLAVAACSDGVDNDGDEVTDFPADPGCRSPDAPLEDPACDDGLDNDRDGALDLADPECLRAGGASEAAATALGCGLGPELAALLAVIAWLVRRRAVHR